MKKSLFTLTLFFLIALFISCTPIIKQDDLCQNDTNVIISLSQPAARFTSSNTYTLSDYTWKLIIYEQNRTIREQKDFNGGQTYQYQTKLEPAVYHISLTGTKRDSPPSIPDTLQAEQTISVTEGEKVKNVILVPHSVYSGEGKLGIYITFNLQDTPPNGSITVAAKLVNYYSKEEIPLKDLSITNNQETNAQAYLLEISPTDSSSNTGYISVPSGLYKIYINLNYKVNDMDKTITLVDDRVDNLLEVVSDKTTSYLLDLCSSTKLKYFTYHGSPSSENKGNGSSADAPAYLDDILKKRYSNPNILEIVINDTTSTLSTSEGTEVPPVPNVDVGLLQEGITYTLNFSKTENGYTYSYCLKKTSPGEIELTASCNSNDLPLRFTNSSSNHINITFEPTYLYPITPSLGEGVSLTYDNSTSETGPSILIPSDLKYNPYYENIPYLIIKNSNIEGFDIQPQLTTSNQELDFSFATETTSDGSIKYYLTTYSSAKVPLYTIDYNEIDYNEIAYASLSDPDSFKYIEDADIANLIDLTIDKDNNLYLLYKYKQTVEPTNSPYKVKKMPRDGNPSKTYIIDNIEAGKTPISVKVGLDGEIYLILESSSNHYFAKLKKNDTCDYYDVVSLSEDSSSNQEDIKTSTITADSSGNIYIAKGTTTTTEQKELLLTYTLTKYTVNGDNVYTRDDNYQPFLQLSIDNTYYTYTLYGESELKELFYSGTDENDNNTYTSNNYLKLSDCYIKGDYIYITVSLSFNKACRGTILKIKLSDGKIAETPKLIDENVYSSDSYNHDEGNFYGPSKIIAIKEDDLYIVDEGCIKADSGQKEKNSLIKLNLNNLSSLSRIKDIDGFYFSETSYSFY
ncbi:MAG: hypothetical protein SPE03_10090 [Treponema sp.]|nr:hypothetical protein [Treponema sp.]